MSWLSRYRIHGVLFVVGLVVFSAVSCERLKRQSSDPHFVLQADAWLNGRLDIDRAKKRGDDWATLETVTLDDGTQARGRHLKTRRTFRMAGGEEIPRKRVKRITGRTYYVSFPSAPAVLMLPQVAIRGHRANDVVTTIIMAALVLPLMFAVLRRLQAAGLSQRTVREDLWLTAALAFGTVFFFAAVQGRVWFTAHVVGVVFCLAYVWCAIEARHPILAGLCLGLATMTRTPMAFMFPLFAFEAWRVSAWRPGVGAGVEADADSDADSDADANAAADADVGPALPDRIRAFVRVGALFAAPIVVIAIIAMIHNYVRFAELGEFGHRYLNVRQQQQMETIGMFSYDYLSRNLAVAFSLLPGISSTAPYISISGHGLAMWFTTPILFLVLWPRVKNGIHRGLWVTVALVAIPTFLYQNSGWFQFGYRFSLDYMVFLILLIAVGGRPLSKIVKGLIIASVIVNLFGAWTFNREYEYYRVDARTYDTVIKH